MSHIGSSRSVGWVGAAGSPPLSLLDSLRRAWPAHVVLACTLLLTFGAWRYAERTVRASEHDRFDRIVASSRTAIERRLETFAQILMGVRALFAGSESVERPEFKSYVAGLGLEGRFPSVRGLGWVPRVPAASRGQHEATMRRGGLAGYQIHPVGSQAEYFPLTYLEPTADLAEGAFGLDVASRPENVAAMERARDTGLPVMTGRLALLRDRGARGFVLFLPVYRGGETPPTVEGRRRGLEGFVSEAFRPDLMMANLVDASLTESVAVELYDGSGLGSEHLLYAREGAPRGRAPTEQSRTMSLEFGGRQLTLHFETRPGFHPLAERFVPYWVLGSGLLISVLAFVITLLQTRALTAARRLGADLQAAERRLRQANDRFELATSAVTSAIYDCTVRSGGVVWTQGLTEAAGYRLDEAGPTRAWWLEHVHPDDRTRVQERFDAAAAGGSDFECEYRFQAKDGHYLDVLDRGRFVRDAAGRPVRIVGSMVDISGRKRAEAVLQASEARHRAVLESAMDAIVGMDHEGRVTEWNPAAERLFGRSRADVLGQEIASVIIPPSYREAHRRGLARYLATGEAVLLGGRVQVSAVRADGSEFPVELTVTRVRMEDPPAFNAYIRDLTGQKRAEAARSSLEAQLQQAQKMEAVGRLAGGVAHDFNNLLTVITGRAHMLLSRLKPGEPLHRDVDLIQKTAHRAVALTSQLLAFSRKQVVQPRILDLGRWWPSWRRCCSG
jgi:PAS domain S-box-containing protein